MKRVMILGSAGSGKSTLARQIGVIVGLPVIHLDSLFWNAGWVETPDDEFLRKVENAASDEKWVIDGNYSRTMDVRLARAETVIFLDFNRYFCLFRVVRRWWRNRGRTREDLAEDCPDKLDKEFLAWVWTYPKRSRPRTLALVDELRSSKKVYHFKTRRSVKKFLEGLDA